MGKGKGKLVGLFANMNAGLFLLELKYTRARMAQNLVKYLNSKLTATLKCVTSNSVRSFQAFGSRESNFKIYRSRTRMYRIKSRHRRNNINTRFEVQLAN